MEKKASVRSLRKHPLNRGYWGALFCLPFVVVFLTFSLYPVLRTLYLSFTTYKGFGAETFNGFKNYERALQDPLFKAAFLNTLKMWGLNIVIQLGLALLLTVIFADMKYRMRGLSIFRALFYLPNLIACSSVAFLFKSLLDWQYGSFNQVLLKFGIIDQPINWLGMSTSAQMVVGVIGAWMWFGNSFIVLMAGVQGINKDYFEAAMLDGAGRWTVFGKITLPLLKPIMIYVAVTSLIGGLQLFDIPYLISGTKGDPGRSLYTAVFYLFNMAFANRQMGYAAALAFVLFVIIAIFSFIAFRVIRGKEKD